MNLTRLALCLTAAVLLTACGGKHSAKNPPPYYQAEPGQTVVDPQSEAGSNALVIPKANQPLGEYNPKLKEPPVIVEVPEQIEEDED
ncbi:MAG: hypothetical protein ACQES2_02930 [Pseudomonadota bacterium]